MHSSCIVEMVRQNVSELDKDTKYMYCC